MALTVRARRPKNVTKCPRTDAERSPATGLPRHGRCRPDCRAHEKRTDTARRAHDTSWEADATRCLDSEARSSVMHQVCIRDVPHDVPHDVPDCVPDQSHCRTAALGQVPKNLPKCPKAAGADGRCLSTGLRGEPSRSRYRPVIVNGCGRTRVVRRERLALRGPAGRPAQRQAHPRAARGPLQPARHTWLPAAARRRSRSDLPRTRAPPARLLTPKRRPPTRPH